MAHKRRSRPMGAGMEALFDLGTIARRADETATARPGGAGKAPKEATSPTPKPVDYWVRGIFRFGDTERTKTVKAVGMDTRLDADVAKFVLYLTEEGWQFPEGRAVLVQMLGVGADDGAHIALSKGKEGGGG